MLFPFARSLSRRAISGVLALWLCVVATGIWAPMARAQMAAQGMEQLCSGHGVPQWVPSLIAHSEPVDAAALHHLIDCPLCLPVLAPPTSAFTQAPQAMPLPAPMGRLQPWLARYVGHWPPPRGPPVAHIYFG